ncbi:alpha/beta hydrolase [Lactococcus termiticola]|uniref:Alpha/beta hydrolase n=1 Tax=Lactococcus termiticola TaxID=2169526 RepID=A0A2R5HHK2_9LACT|nr:alpha/beta hydrolase [Lactococcus termiticola]GBG97533.1 alpha/beta hydrolase [Lactococcus termiticola]
MKKKVILGGLSVLAVIIVIALVAATFYFYQIACIRSNKPTAQVAKDSPNYSLVEKFDQLEKTDKTIEQDGLKLKAWYVPAAQKTDKTVIVVHGFRSDKEAMRQYGELFHELGYNVLMPDNRGHGSSEGKYITYGQKDKEDVISWAKLIGKENPASKISLFGLSMGAATVMMASGQADLPVNVQNIIEDCGYSSVWDEVTYQAKSGYKIPAFPLVYGVSLMNKIRQGWFFQEAKSTDALAKDKLPILMIHGGNDTYVPTRMLDINYKAVKAGTPKEKLLVPGAAHAMSFETNPSLYRKTVADFMAKYNPIQ